jgi:uncharacterized integral membrane protein
MREGEEAGMNGTAGDGDPAGRLSDADRPAAQAPPSDRPPLRTRAGWAWVAVCAAALVAVALIVFIAQNTQRAEVSFLWLDSDAPVAVLVLIAAAAGAVITAAFGTIRILQLRRAVKRAGR